MSAWTHGSAVNKTTRKVNFLSASAIQKADASSSEGCLRAWWYAYVAGVKEPPTAAMERGIKFHGEIEQYLKTGVRALSSQVLAGMFMIPEPGPDLLVEHSMVPLGADGKEDLSLAPLRVAGIPFLGKIDLMHNRGINQGASDVEDTRDPPGTVEVLDWKSVGRMDHAKSGNDLPKLIQMASYAQYVFDFVLAKQPEIERVRLSHAYFPMKGNPRKSTRLVTREDVLPTWKRTVGLAGCISDAAKETNPDRVDANTRACHAYGRDCPAKVAGLCTASAHSTLASLVGQSAASDMLIQLKKKPTDMSDPTPTSSFAGMPLLQQIQAKAANPSAPAAFSPLASLAAPKPAPPSPAEIAAEMLRLKRQELDARHPGLMQRLADIEACGLGKPQYNGELAQFIADWNGWKLEGGGYAGADDLAKFSFGSPADIHDGLVTEARSIAAKVLAERAGQVVAPAPATPIPVASTPVVEATPTPVVEAPKKKGPGRPRKEKPAETAAAPASAPYVPAPVVTPSSTPEPSVHGSNAWERGEVPIVQQIAEAAPTDVAPVVATAVMPNAHGAPAVAITTGTDTRINFFVDCVVDGMPTRSIWPEVYKLTGIMNEKSGCADYRLAPKDSVYAYGGSKGILAAMVKQTVWEPGNYTLDGSFGDVAGTVIEAFREVVYNSGGVFVRGAR